MRPSLSNQLNQLASMGFQDEERNLVLSKKERSRGRRHGYFGKMPMSQRSPLLLFAGSCRGESPSRTSRAQERAGATKSESWAACRFRQGHLTLNVDC